MLPDPCAAADELFKPVTVDNWSMAVDITLALLPPELAQAVTVSPTEILPPSVCRSCRDSLWWLEDDGTLICRTCEPSAKGRPVDLGATRRRVQLRVEGPHGRKDVTVTMWPAARDSGIVLTVRGTDARLDHPLVEVGGQAQRAVGVRVPGVDDTVGFLQLAVERSLIDALSETHGLIQGALDDWLWPDLTAAFPPAQARAGGVVSITTSGTRVLPGHLTDELLSVGDANGLEPLEALMGVHPYEVEAGARARIMQVVPMSIGDVVVGLRRTIREDSWELGDAGELRLTTVTSTGGARVDRRGCRSSGGFGGGESK